MSKAADAFRTISEVADELEIQKHVLRFWENRFPQIKPMKRGGGRRYYRPEDLELLRGIQHLLHAQGYTIRGVQRILRVQGVDAVKRCWREGEGIADPPRSARASAGRASGGKPAAPARSGAGPTARSVIAAAVRELEACRALLSGAPVPQAAAGRRGSRQA